MLLRSTRPILSIFIATFLAVHVLGFTPDDEPEIEQRVARVSAIDGEVLIKRGESADWEKAVLNLPIVEGDVISAGEGARFEVQFDSKNFLRGDSLTTFTLTTLQQSGIAVSLQRGTIVVRMNEIDTASEYFEIDAPRTTIAVQRAGEYVVSTADQLNSVDISVFDDGEARVYSETSGFSLRSGRAARLFISGDNQGEWDMRDADRGTLAILAWAAERDLLALDRLKNAQYGKYYDDDIYGADELNDYGDWTFDRDYGYVWQPNYRAVSSYSNWSPYRYGHWRWLPYYGWTWVNDEPWGWATYHYGRWIWINGKWFWSPYGYYRTGRSWWRPALVYMTIYNGSVCWYPLPYNYRYYNYNRRYKDRWTKSVRNNNPGPVATNPVPTPVPGPDNNPIPSGRTRGNMPPLATVPPGGVVGLPLDQFGQKQTGRPLSSQTAAREVLSRPIDPSTTPPILPPIEQIKTRPDPKVFAARPATAEPAPTVRTGATVRNAGAPLDNQLQRSRIFGDREPVRSAPIRATTPGSVAQPGGRTTAPPTGAVTRPVPTAPPSTPIRTAPPTRSTDSGGNTSRPVTERPTPQYVPPTRSQPAPRNDPPPSPPVRSQPAPRNDPPPTRSQPAPRNDPPPTRSQPAPKSDPPPTKSEPTKPAPSSQGKDG